MNKVLIRLAIVIAVAISTVLIITQAKAHADGPATDTVIVSSDTVATWERVAQTAGYTTLRCDQIDNTNCYRLGNHPRYLINIGGLTCVQYWSHTYNRSHGYCKVRK